MKFAQIATGQQYQGKDGEIRLVQRIVGRPGQSIDAVWVSTNRCKNGRLATGRCPVDSLARWAVMTVSGRAGEQGCE